MNEQEQKEEFLTFQGYTSNGIPSNDDEYIKQFLVFDHELPQIEETVEIGPIHLQKEDPEEEIFEETTPLEDESEISHKHKRSPLHNFQKHFVTTIRRGVRITWPSEMPEYMKLAKEMWEIFRNSKKYTKEFVSLILGQNDPCIDQELLKKYGLSECVNQYKNEDYHKAQYYLKDQVLETFREIPKEKIMYERRIAKKEEFANYFFKVLSEIEEGVMNKRLPKKKRGGKKNSNMS